MKALAPLAIAGTAFAIGIANPATLGLIVLLAYAALYGPQALRGTAPAAQTA
ncbi:hypothetical protein [Hyphococcus sp.]|uniref:hypothetical protein n=1 Tax=Hyphococcus sp. TaxID=2038636 RepID=UPI003D0FB8BE